MPQLYLWDPDVYRDKNNGLTLYRGIVIGIATLLALFLTVVFVVKGAIIFPAAAALAWAVLVYAGIDFGFFNRVFGLLPASSGVYRAISEAVLAATLLVFLFAYLNLNRWHVRYSHLTLGWLLFLGALIGLALFNPSFAAGVARVSIGAVAAIGLILIIYLSTHGYDRAVMLIPTWLLLLLWVTAGALVVNGQISNETVGPALIGGLVLIVMLIGFTVMQHAFRRSLGREHGGGNHAQGAGPVRLRRCGFRLGPVHRPYPYRPGDRTAAWPKARLARGLRLRLACARPSVRPRSVFVRFSTWRSSSVAAASTTTSASRRRTASTTGFA